MGGLIAAPLAPGLAAASGGYRKAWQRLGMRRGLPVSRPIAFDALFPWGNLGSIYLDKSVLQMAWNAPPMGRYRAVSPRAK